jgi:hypothetical protein
MVALVERMLDLHEKLAAATVRADKSLCQPRPRPTMRRSTRSCMPSMV